ncbi:MAG TPA: glycosyltransferase family 87 protein [Candidatus Limnocylindrales bacterium]|nr:glycosyltransferase family 87 protein [Candidatus Limnocylindrales bacterium]
MTARATDGHPPTDPMTSDPRRVTPGGAPTPPQRRAGVVRRALRREAVRIREPRRMLAMSLLIVVFALALAGMTARGDRAGADAQAYWAAVRIWLEGGNPYHPTGPFLPYVYAPWMLPLFTPWSLLPWDVAWFAWRGATILLLLWSIRWAYSLRPLPTAILVAILAFPMAANLDTGNINLLLALMIFAAHFTGGRLGGLLWGIATWMKWVPAPLWFVLPPRARGWGLAFLAISGLLSLALLPLTILQLQALFGFGERPFRADYLVFIWSAVPWWWQLRDPFAFLRPSAWREAAAFQSARLRRWAAAFRQAPGAVARDTWREGHAAARRYVGLDDAEPRVATRTAPIPAVVGDAVD